MAKKKKVNPYRIPATQGDIEKAKRDATNTAVASTWAIMFSVLRDKEGYDYDRLRRIWDETNYLADSIARKYVKHEKEKRMRWVRILASTGYEPRV